MFFNLLDMSFPFFLSFYVEKQASHSISFKWSLTFSHVELSFFCNAYRRLATAG